MDCKIRQTDKGAALRYFFNLTTGNHLMENLLTCPVILSRSLDCNVKKIIYKNQVKILARH